MRQFFAIGLFTLLAACGPKPEAGPAVAATSPTAKPAAPSPLPSHSEISGTVPDTMALADYAKATPGDFPFDLKLTLTRDAATSLASKGEQVTLSAMFWGEANASAEAQAAKDEMGMIDLGDDRIDVPPQSQTARITGRSIDKAKLKLIQGDPKVLINVYSARKAGPDNVLECGLYENTIKAAQKTPIEIKCGLLPVLPPIGPK